jgi:hypothetical protein
VCSFYTRTDDVQTELNTETRETILWDVKWINDCSYYLKYNSGAEGRPKKEMDILKKHKIAIEIVSVTQDYYVYKSSPDRTGNPTIMTGTLWIKQRRGL